MKILLLAPHPFFTNRGTPIAVRAVLAALSDQGHDIDVLSFHEGSDIDIPRVTHHRAPRPLFVRRVPIGPSWQKALCDLCLFFSALRLLRNHNYHLIHAVEESAFFARIFRRLFKIPYVFDMDSLMSQQILEKSRWLYPASALFQFLERGAIRHSAGVLAVCPALVDEALRHHPARNVALLPDIPFTGTQPGHLPDSLTSAPPIRIMYVGNLETYQGIDLLLNAFSLIAASCPQATLLIVGGSSEHIAQYQSRCHALCSTNRIRFVGQVPIDQLGSVLAYADILVSPRIKGQNTPMKIYSYLQSGKPVLATRLPTHTQVLDHHVALLTDPTPAAFSQGLRQLITSPDLRANLGHAGQNYVQREFSEATFRRRLHNFYTSLPTAHTPTLQASPTGDENR
jgi:glycosyltransferase involved in cell wall biosynthesis